MDCFDIFLTKYLKGIQLLKLGKFLEVKSGFISKDTSFVMWLTTSKNSVLIQNVCWLIDRQTASLTDWLTGYRHKAQYITIVLFDGLGQTGVLL